MKPSLLLLTNPQNIEPKEDSFLADFLLHTYHVTVAHPLEAEKCEDSADIILVRNIWPTKPHRKEYAAMHRRFVEKKLKVYNPPAGSGDMQGKKYLVELWKRGLPVIPSVSSVNKLDTLPPATEYLIKPFYGGVGVGIRRLTREKLLRETPKEYIIQPLLKLQQEISFYYIDGELQHVLGTRDIRHRWELAPFTPTAAQMQIAQEFVAWNTLPYGIQRIDFALTKHGEFLLMEIEDWCPYLSLLEIQKETRTKFLARFLTALHTLHTTTS
ncbi:MAG: hypothetical protein HYW65_04665 [Candidatus Liptonbacteria bacterium]|nr:hypothetical protein [Candidatus Liptonbacteria bacterium]